MNKNILVPFLASVLLVLISCSSSSTKRVPLENGLDYVDIYCYPFDVEFVKAPSHEEIIANGGHTTTKVKDIIKIFNSTLSNSAKGINNGGRCILIKNKSDRLYITQNKKIIDSKGNIISIRKLQRVVLMREIDKALRKIKNPSHPKEIDNISTLVNKLNPILYYYNNIDFCIPNKNTDTIVGITQKVKRVLTKQNDSYNAAHLCEALKKLYPCKVYKRKNRINACKAGGHSRIGK